MHDLHHSIYVVILFQDITVKTANVFCDTYPGRFNLHTSHFVNVTIPLII